MAVNAHIIDAVRTMVLMRMSFEERLGSHLKRVEQELQAAKAAAVKPAGLTVPQYAALFVLDENGTIAWSYCSPIAVNPGADGILDALDRLNSKETTHGDAQGAHHAA